MKKLVLTAPVLAAAMALASCGSDIPTDASTSEFCSLFPHVDEALDEWDSEGDKDKVDEVVEHAREDGVPAGMTEADLDTFGQFVEALDDNDTYDEYSAAVEPLENDLQKLESYVDATC